MSQMARIAIVFETAPDFQILRRHLGRLVEWEVPYTITAASALHSPEHLTRWIAECERQGVKVFIVAAGGSASLAGAVAARTDCPVIGVPLDTTHLRGQDALYAMAELPVGAPVGVMGINNVENALHYAIRLVALHHPEYGLLLRRLRDGCVGKEAQLLDNLRDQYPEVFEPEKVGTVTSAATASTEAEPSVEQREIGEEVEAPSPPLAAEKDGGEKQETTSAEAAVGRRRGPARRIVVDPEQPDVAAIEQVVDILLEGGIVALPTDTVYGLAAVSTNGDAVRRLYEIKARELGRPIPLLIHSLRGLPRLVRHVPDAIERLLDAVWPGALTVVFRKFPGSFAEISQDDTIGLRVPDHTVTLAVISMLARPLAVTSANRSGQPPAVTADQVLETFGDCIQCVLDAGQTPGEKVSTVLSAVESPFRVLREGAISRQELKAILGEDLAEE